MKSLLILLVANYLISSSLSAPVEQLPVPQLKKANVYEDRLVLKWNPVEVDEGNPILGYKVKMWEEEQKQVFFFDEIDGVKQLVSKFEPVNTNMARIPSSKPIVVIVGPQETEATIKGIKEHVSYQIRLQTFNQYGEGPYSSPTGIKLGNDMPNVA